MDVGDKFPDFVLKDENGEELEFPLGFKDLPEDFEFPDALLDEAAAIANDFASLIEQKRYLARTTPIFTRFSVSFVAEDHKASSGIDRQ